MLFALFIRPIFLCVFNYYFDTIRVLLGWFAGSRVILCGFLIGLAILLGCDSLTVWWSFACSCGVGLIAVLCLRFD